MKRLATFAAAVLLAACSSTDYDQPAPRRAPAGRRPPMSADGRGATEPALGLMPMDNWWHDPQIAEPLRLTGEQYAALDRIQADQGDELARLQRDTMVAMRDFRQSLTADKPAQDDIVAAGQRVRALRDQILDRQVRLIAAERVVLNADQWQTLQQQLQGSRDDWRQNRSAPGGRRGGWGGGMGGRGGRGGWGF